MEMEMQETEMEMEKGKRTVEKGKTAGKTEKEARVAGFSENPGTLISARSVRSDVCEEGLESSRGLWEMLRPD